MTISKMEDLKSNMCRWPFGDPRQKDKFHFCGAPRDGASAYCCMHERMARRSNETGSATKKAA